MRLIKDIYAQTKNKGRRIALALLLAITTAAWGHSTFIYAKATLAQVLIANAWQKSVHTKTTMQPWPWADTWPIAKLRFDTLGKELYVLAGSHGSSLAFGPGHLDGTAQPGETGTSIISGHRDTHFSILSKLKIDDELSVQQRNGQWVFYKVVSQKIIDLNHSTWSIDKNTDELHLVTCYPFDSALPQTSLRHISIALPIEATVQAPIEIPIETPNKAPIQPSQLQNRAELADRGIIKTKSMNSTFTESKHYRL